ncbi:hypothetical protein FRB94_002058 [Tulasnella sp. JGI-2019a]|nr:hypothetical protein FRB94_002058 [Tulasnella sp. JGI-2019a]
MPPTNIRPEYVDELQQHIAHIQRHASGSDEGVWGPDDLPHTVFPPGTVWTPHEKRLFFHALTRYSRFKPDLIASHIHTKSEVDVSVYLDTLETARWSSTTPTTSDLVFEPALEAHESLISFEEKESSKLNRMANRYEAGLRGTKILKRMADADLESSPSPKKQRTTDDGRPSVLSRDIMVAAHRAMTAKYFPARETQNKNRGSDSILLARERKLQADMKALRDIGLTEERLSQDRLDIFRLDRLAFLNKNIYSNLVPDDGKKRSRMNMTYRFLELLRSYLIAFVSDVMHHAISIADVRFQSKQGTKVFGNVEKEVLSQHVIEATKLVGLTWSCDSFFEDLPCRLGLHLVDFNSDGQELLLQPSVGILIGDAHSARSGGGVNLVPSLHQREPLEPSASWLPASMPDDESFGANDDVGDEDENEEVEGEEGEEEAVSTVIHAEKEIDMADAQLEKIANLELTRLYQISKRK